MGFTNFPWIFHGFLMGFTMFYHVYPANSWVSPCFSRDFPRQAPQRALQHALAAAKAAGGTGGTGAGGRGGGAEPWDTHGLVMFN